MKELRLRVVSGPHLGTEISLLPGTYVLGSQESCDLVFMDDSVAPRHLVLEIKELDEDFELSVKALDGKVLVDGREISAGQAVLPGKPLAFGYTAIVFGDVDSVTLVPLEFVVEKNLEKNGENPIESQAQGEKSESLEEGAVVQVQDGIVDQDTSMALGELPDSGPGLAEESEAVPLESLTFRQKIRAKAPLLSGLGLLLLIMALMLHNWSSVDRQALAASDLTFFLNGEGFKTIEVSSKDKELVIEGTLDNDDELVRLVKILRTKPLKTFLKIQVRHDILRAVRESLSSRGFYPEVTISNDGLIVSVFMKNKLVEERVFGELVKEIPDVPKISRYVVYADNLDSVLKSRFSQLEMKIDFGYRDGLVELYPESDSQDLDQKFSDIFAELQEDLKVPLVFALDGHLSRSVNQPVEVISSQTSPQAALQPVASSKNSANNGDLIQNISKEDLEVQGLTKDGQNPIKRLGVTAITLNPMRYISTRNGLRLFEGSKLSGGYIITSISAETITCLRDGVEEDFMIQNQD